MRADPPAPRKPSARRSISVTPLTTSEHHQRAVPGRRKWQTRRCRRSVAAPRARCPSGTEDANHFAYDSEGLWIALNSGRYGLKASDILPFANTYTDVILATVNNGLFAGKVDGTSGAGHASGDNYVRDEYYYYTEFRPDKYAFMAGIDISRNKAHSSPPITARILWEKNRRYIRGQ